MSQVDEDGVAPQDPTGPEDPTGPSGRSADVDAVVGAQEPSLEGLAFASAPNALLLVDQDLVVVAASRRAAILLGPGPVVGRPLAHLVRASGTVDAAAVVRRVLAGHTPGQPPGGQVLDVATPDGPMLVELHVAAAETPGGVTAIVELVDLTARLALERQLGQLHRMHVTGQLMHLLAHDVRSYLHAIGWSLDMLEADLPAAHPAQRDVGRLRSAVDEGLGAIGEVLELARPARDGRGPTDVTDHLRHLAPLIDRLLGARVRLEMDVADELPPVTVHASMVSQLVVDLAVDAREALGEGGVFRIVARPAIVAGGRVVRVVVDRSPDPERPMADAAAGAGGDGPVGPGLVSSALTISRAGGRVTLEDPAARSVVIDLPVDEARTPPQSPGGGPSKV